MPIIVIGAVCIFAVWKGGKEARVAGGSFALAAAITPFLHDRRWIGPQWATFAVDIVFMAILLTLALRTKRYWPLFAAGFQLLTVLTHAASMVDKKLGAWAYITASVIWSYLCLFAIGLGAWNCWMLQRESAAFNESAGDDATRR